MDFSFTEEQQMLKASVRNFLEKEIAPVVSAHEKKGPLTKAETEAGRLLSFRALDLIDKGQKSRWQASLAKAYATEAAVRTTSKAIQIHGAMGLSDEYPVERYFRDARTMTIPEGTTQMQKLIVWRDILGLRAMA